jgi:hypothetical protein
VILDIYRDRLIDIYHDISSKNIDKNKMYRSFTEVKKIDFISYNFFNKKKINKSSSLRFKKILVKVFIKEK